MNEDDWKSFTNEARATVLRSQEILLYFQNLVMQPEHLLLAVLESSDPVIIHIFEALNIDLYSVKDQVEEAIKAFPKVEKDKISKDQIYVSASVMQAMDSAIQEAKHSQGQNANLKIIHILLGLLTIYWEPTLERNRLGTNILRTNGVTIKRVKKVYSSQSNQE